MMLIGIDAILKNISWKIIFSKEELDLTNIPDQIKIAHLFLLFYSFVSKHSSKFLRVNERLLYFSEICESSRAGLLKMLPVLINDKDGQEIFFYSKYKKLERKKQLQTKKL